MDVKGYRNSGELSDITIVIEGEEFNLHRFPLFVRSFYFKDLTLDGTNDGSRVELKNFPGGPRIFSIIADYCYNKEVNVNQENVIAVRCAAEYLKMTISGSGCSGLALLAENKLFDLTYSAKARKDYQSILLLLKKAAEFADLSEKCMINRKIIDSFTENLAMHVKSTNIYDSIGLYDKSPSLFAPKKSLHNLCLNEDQIGTINSLPLKWMNDLIRSAVRYNLNQMLLSYLIQNYIDYNTGLNPHYNQDSSLLDRRIRKQSILSSESDESNFSSDKKLSNLVSMAGDILNTKSSEDNLSNLVSMAGDILNTKSSEDNLSNLISMAGDILIAEKNLENLAVDEEKSDNLINIAGDILNKSNENENENTVEALNLVKIASDILISSNQFSDSTENENESEKADNNLSEVAENYSPKLLSNEEQLDKDEDSVKTLNLIKMASDVLLVEENLEKYAEENDKPSNLIAIADDILVDSTETPHNSLSAGDILERNDNEIKRTEENLSTPGTQLDDKEKLNIIKQLTNIIVELRFDPKFSLSWLQVYLNSLHEIKADAHTKSTFNRWTWNAINDLKGNPQELTAIPPAVMEKMVEDIAAYEGISKNEFEKLIELIDCYIADMNVDSKVNCSHFIKLVSSVPKEKRSNFDSIALHVIKILQNDKTVDPELRSSLIDLVDFEKINEQTLKFCRTCPYIPAENISEAALALCTKLRNELDEAKFMLKTHDLKTKLSQSISSIEIPSYSTVSYSTSEKPVYSSGYSSSKYNMPTVTLRNRSIETKSNANSRISLQKTTEPARVNQSSSNYITTPSLTNKYSYSSPTTSSTSYNTNYPSGLKREVRFLSPMRRGLSTVINSTYKSSNYNPSPTNYSTNNSYTHHYHHDHAYLDNLEDDYGDCNQNYYDTNTTDYCCSAHNYHYSRIY